MLVAILESVRFGQDTFRSRANVTNIVTKFQLTLQIWFSGFSDDALLRLESDAGNDRNDGTSEIGSFRFTRYKKDRSVLSRADNGKSERNKKFFRTSKDSFKNYITKTVFLSLQCGEICILNLWIFELFGAQKVNVYQENIYCWHAKFTCFKWTWTATVGN